MMQVANSLRLSVLHRHISHALGGRGQAFVPVMAILLVGFAGAGCKAKATGEVVSQPASGTEAVVGAVSGEPTPLGGGPVGMIASGSAEPIATLADATEPAPAASGGRGVKVEEAAAKVPFGLLEPVDLPSTTHRDMVRLTEVDTGAAAAPGLPSVRFVYTVDDGSLVLLQTAATGEAAEGEAITIGSHSGWRTSEDPLVVVWEQDGVRLELRGSGVSPELLMAAAASMEPLGAWPGPLEAPNADELTATAESPAAAGTATPTGQTG